MVSHETSAPAPLLSAPEIPEEPSYRPISKLAIISLLVALISLVALIHPPIWMIPPMAVLVCLYTLRRLSDDSNRLSGKSLVYVGLIVATLVGVYSPTRFLTRRVRLADEARQRADAWFVLLQEGRLQEAHQLHLPEHNRQLPGESLDMFYRRTAEAGDPSQMMMAEMSSPAADLAQFFGQPPLKEFIARRDRMIVKFEGVGEILRENPYVEHVELFYRISDPTESDPDGLLVTVRLARTVDHEQGEAEWHVTYVEAAK